MANQRRCEQAARYVRDGLGTPAEATEKFGITRRGLNYAWNRLFAPDPISDHAARLRPPIIRESHGHSGYGPRKASPTYISWASMISRCLNPNAHLYERYGGRGIAVCDRWRSFVNFLEDMGERPEGKTLDRYPDPDGNYEPGNCRWATDSEQQMNKTVRSGGRPRKLRCAACAQTAKRCATCREADLLITTGYEKHVV